MNKGIIFVTAKLHKERLLSFLHTSAPYKSCAVVLKHFRSLSNMWFRNLEATALLLCLIISKH